MKKKNHPSKHLGTHKIRKSELHYAVQQAGPPAPPARLATVHPLLQKEIQQCCKEEFLWLDRHLLAKKKCLFIILAALCIFFPVLCYTLNTKDFTTVFASIHQISIKIADQIRLSGSRDGLLKNISNVED